MDANPEPEARDAIAFVLALAKALHRYGTPAHRLEESIVKCCRQLGLDDAEVFTTPTTIIMSFGQPAELRTRMLRVEGAELDMGKLARVDELADQVISHAITAADGLARLAEIIAARPPYSHLLSTSMHAVTAGALAVFFGGGLADVAVAGFIGLVLGVFAQVVRRASDQAHLFEVFGAALAALVAGTASALWSTVSAPVVTVAALIVLLPGMSLTVAMTELATRNLIAGTARLMSAVLVLLELVVGVALGERAVRALVEINPRVPVPLPEVAQWIALGAAAIGVAVVVQAAPRAFGWILAACVVGYAGSRAGIRWLGPDLGPLVGALAVGVLGNIYARWLDRPSQVVTVPAVLLLVPGSLGFRAMTSLLGHDTVSGVETLFAMFIVTVSIVAGLLVSNAIVSPRRSL